MRKFFGRLVRASDLRRSKIDRRPRRLGARLRHPSFELLEPRQLLSVTVGTIGTQTLLAGAPLNLALNGTSSNTSHQINYNVSVSNPKITATVEPQSNPSIDMRVDVDTTDASGNPLSIHGDMIFQLYKDLVPTAVDHFMSLVQNGFGSGTNFYRVIQTFMIQGGDPSSTAANWDDQITQNLQFTSAGVLAMANGGSDTNSSQFFITTQADEPDLNFRYTVVGFLTKGADILQAIARVQTHAQTGATEVSTPNDKVTITSITAVTDTQNGVLRLSAPTGTTGAYTVTVTATDVTTNETSQPVQFQVNVQADSAVNPPFLQPISPIVTTAGATNVPFSIPTVNVSGGAMTYSASLMTDGFTGTLVATTGQGTVTTPTAGVYGIQVGVTAANPATNENTSIDHQDVPIYVNPLAPTGIKLLAVSDTGSSNSDHLTDLNNTTGKTLQFEVDGVLPGADVKLFAGGTLIGEATASTAAGTNSVTVTTNGTAALADGVRSITATQTLKNQTVAIGNLKTTTDLASAASAALSITVDTAAPQFSSTPVTTAKVGVAYSYQVAVNAAVSGTVTYALSQPPAGMAINSTTGLITWTPPITASTTTNVTVQATDAAGNVAPQQFAIAVTGNAAPVIATAASPVLGTIHANTPGTFKLTGSFINNGTGTTIITDADANAVVGIAVTGVAGNGTWQYSLDGYTYQAITPVSDASALLLLTSARLRYIPNGQGSDAPTITYRAWDATSGTSGGRANLSTAAALGGFTAFSTASDTATLTVSSITDATVLTPAEPSLGKADYNTAKTVSLSGSFINNGTGTTTITTSTSGDVEGAIAVVGTVGLGTWAYSLDGTTFTAINSTGGVSSSSALLLPTTAKLRYTPNGSNAEVATITYRGWDATGTAGTKVDATTNGGTSHFSLFTDVASLTVSLPNHAPVLTAASPSLGSTGASTAKTISLSGSFVNNGTGTTTITDADTGAVLGGIAITAKTGKGTWAYSLDGATFTSLGTVSTTAALLLPKTASLRYTPSSNDPETPTISYRAWDATSGASGTLADTTTTGGTAAFSTQTDTASLTVNRVPPAGYTITSDQSQITELNASSTGFKLGGATVGTTYNYKVTSSGGGTPVTGNGTITAATQDITGIDVSSLPNGTLTYSVTLSNQAGTGVAATAAATLYQATGGLSGYVYLDATNSGQWTAACPGIGGVTIRLFSEDSQGNATEVAGKSPIQTDAKGWYSFDGLPAGKYQIRETPPPEWLNGKYSVGSLGGTAYAAPGQVNQVEVQLGTGDTGTGYDFCVQGIHVSRISLRMFLASAPRGSALMQSVHLAPSINLTGSTSAGYTSALPTDGSAVAIAPTASISRTDSPTLTSMTVTLVNPPDGAAEILDVDLKLNTSGAVVTKSFSNQVLTLSGVADVAVYEALLQGITYNDTAPTLTSGNRTLQVVVNDGTRSSQVVTATVAVSSSTARLAITPDQSYIGVSTASSTGFSFSHATVGDTYSYSISSSSGGTPVSGSGPVTSPTQDVTGINVSALTDGTLTFNVTLSDASGQLGPVATATATLDRVAPSGYAITANQSTIGTADAPSTGFTFTGAETGTTYKYTVSSSGGTATVTGSGTVTSATQSVTGINVSSLPNGTLTFKVTLTDRAGNTGNEASATAQLSKTASSGYSITPDQSLVVAATAASTGFTFTGATLGDKYNYSISSSGGGTSVTGSGTVNSATQDVTGIDVSHLADGTLTFSVTLTDAGGSTGTTAVAVATLDQVAPAGYTIAPNKSAYGTTSASSASFIFASAVVGAKYNYTITSSGGGSPVTGSGNVTSATQTVSGIDFHTLPAGTVTFSVTLSDTAGHAAPAATATATLNTTVPSGYTITADKANYGTASDSSAGFTFAGATQGMTYNCTVTSSGSTTASVTKTGAVTSATQDVTGIDISSLPDGTLTFSVTLTENTYGNTGAAATATAKLDKAKPAGYQFTLDQTLIDGQAAQAMGFTLTGAEKNADYHYTVVASDQTHVDGGSTVTADSGTQHVPNINLSSLPDGTVTFNVWLTDAAGNVGDTKTLTATLDKAAPGGYSVVPAATYFNHSTAASAGFSILGVQQGMTYSYTISSDGEGGGDPVTVNDIPVDSTTGTQPVTGINVSTLADGNLTISVTLKSQGHSGPQKTATAILDTVVPAGYDLALDNTTIDTTTTGFTINNAEVGTTYHYTITDSAQKTITGSGPVTADAETEGALQVTDVSLASLASGQIDFEVWLTDAAGNEGEHQTDTATLTSLVPSYSIAPLTDAQKVLNATTAHSAGFTLNVSNFADGMTYTYTVIKDGVATTLTDTGTVTAASQPIGPIDLSSISGDATINFRVTVTNGNGTGNPVDSDDVLLKQSAPSAPQITLDKTIIGSLDASSIGFTFSGAEQGSTYHYTVNSSNGGTQLSGDGPIVTGDEHVSNIDVSHLGDGTLTFEVWLTDPVLNNSEHTTAQATLDQTPPSYQIELATASVGATNAVLKLTLDNAEPAGATFYYIVTNSNGTISTSGQGDVQADTLQQDLTGIDLSTIPEGTVHFEVWVTDSLGNVGTHVKFNGTLDTTAPKDYAIAANQSLIDSSNDQSASFRITHGEPNTTCYYTVISSNGGTPVSGNVAINTPTFDVMGLDVSGLNDGTLTYTAHLVDPAGNIGPDMTATATLQRI